MFTLSLFTPIVEYVCFSVEYGQSKSRVKMQINIDGIHTI